MTEWKPLPDSTASDVRQLVVELRALKDRSGLSLAGLAERTLYSKSSWERCLNGRALPPQHAVISLGKLADADPARLMALWDLAGSAWHDHDGTAPPAGTAAKTADSPDPPERLASPAGHPADGGAPAPTAAPPKDHGVSRRLKWAAVGLAAAVVSGGVLVGVLVGVPHHGSPAGSDRAAGATGTDRQLDVSCFAESCGGKDPKQSGCGGDAWTSALTRTGLIYVELRYSDACKAAWARISWARPGDTAQVVGPRGRTYEGTVHYDTDNFSPMVAAASPSAARACALLTSGTRACTGPGGTQHLTEPPQPPTSTGSASTSASTSAPASQSASGR